MAMLLGRLKAAFTTRKCCELLVLFSSIALVWILLSLPILFYYVPKEEKKVCFIVKVSPDSINEPLPLVTSCLANNDERNYEHFLGSKSISKRYVGL